MDQLQEDQKLKTTIANNINEQLRQCLQCLKQVPLSKQRILNNLVEQLYNKEDQQLQKLEAELENSTKQLHQQQKRNEQLMEAIYNADKNVQKQCYKLDKVNHQKIFQFHKQQKYYKNLSEFSYTISNHSILQELFYFHDQNYLNTDQITIHNLAKLLPPIQYIFSYGCSSKYKRKYVRTIDLQNQIIILRKQISKNNVVSTYYDQVSVMLTDIWLPQVVKQLCYFKDCINYDKKDQEIYLKKIQSRKQPTIQDQGIKQFIKSIIGLFKWIQQFSEV